MFARANRLLLACAAAATAIGVSSTGAAAATWTVNPGGAWTADYTATTTGTFKDITANVTLNCPVSSASGTLKSGAGLAGAGISSVIASFGTNTNPCTGPDGYSGSGGPGGAAWSVNAVAYAGGVTTGTITSADIIFGLTGILGTCVAEAKGTVNITYTNKTALLAVTSATLTLVKVTGSPRQTACGPIAVNDSMNYITSANGGYLLNPAQTITSP
jgi:hypothetical protein